MICKPDGTYEIEQSDIDTANQMSYNMEATKFQYDFLNGDYDVLPEGLRTAIDSGKEILFLILVTVDRL